VHDLARARILPLTGANAATISADMAALATEGRRRLAADELPGVTAHLGFSADLRYRGQAFELTLPVMGETLDAAAAQDLVARFHQLHLQRFSFNDPGETVELVTLRLAATGRIAAPPEPALAAVAQTAEAVFRKVHLSGEMRNVRIVQQDTLNAGAVLDGPAIVEQAYTSLLILPGWRLVVAPSGDLMAERLDP
jgi:N-methylhydantoinase A